MSIINTLVLVLEIVIAFIMMLFVHELGHFIFAKRAGVLIREFSIGMGPKVFSIKKGETKYSLRILPIGAYVSMAGEEQEIYNINIGKTIGIETDNNNIITDIFIKPKEHTKLIVEEFDIEERLYLKGLDENENSVNFSVSKVAIVHLDGKQIQIAPKDRQLSSKSVSSRFLSIFGGPMFNIFLALILFFTIAIIVGVPSNQVIIGEVTENSPAEQAELKAGDKIIGINDLVFDTAGELILMLQNSPDKELDLNIVRDENKMDIKIIPEDMDGIGIIGIRTLQVYTDVSFIDAIKTSFSEVGKWIGLIFDSFKMLFAGDVGMDDVAGPVGIVQITSDAAKAGIFTLMNWTAILSLYLGVFNLLPIPALDGSRLLFLLVEAVRGKPVDPKKESFVHFIGFALLMLLMIFITVNDVSRLFE